MATDKYDLTEISYSTEGWNGDLTTNMQNLDSNLHTRQLVTLGETVSEGDALYLNTDGKWYKAQADGTKQPARGLAYEAGDADDEIRMQRIGPMTKSGWNFATSYALWLHPSTAGALTHTKPGSDAQLIGYATGNTTIFIEIGNIEDVAPSFFGTTTTTTTTTTSTTTTTT